MINIAKKIVLVAGKEIMKIYEGDFDVEIKEDNSPITIADKKANEIILKELENTYIPVLSEEKKDSLNRLDSEYLWVVDPIDGTKDFINKTGEFSIMIGLVKNGKPIMGVVYAPAKNKLYYAQAGKGSFLEENGETIKLEINKKNHKILISRNHTTDKEFKLIEELNLEAIACGSIGVKFGLIAEGKAGNYLNLSNKLKEWDLVAPQIILEEAGGKVTDTLGNCITYNTKQVNLENGCIGTNKTNHQLILDKLK
ncbi:MAG: 3'(2'),5'-bisphosphate nucleotidase CysQ [Candidatus Gracilibacteria bacterium]|nr:3'(2'),5'-bisphosphate nucleotidase CysQ [Candidatus Gracilibacteria bacterium]